MKYDYVVDLKIEKVFDNENVQVGYIYKIIGTFVYGAPVSTVEKIREQMAKLKDIALTDLVAIDTTELKRWDSLGVTSVIKPIVDANQQLIKKGRAAIYLIGDLNTDKFKAVKDKYPQFNSTAVLPWSPSVEKWKHTVLS